MRNTSSVIIGTETIQLDSYPSQLPSFYTSMELLGHSNHWPARLASLVTTLEGWIECTRDIELFDWNFTDCIANQ